MSGGPSGVGDRVTQFLDDVLAAPDELAAVLAVQSRAVAGLPPDAVARPRWRLIGMGSSRFAALDAAWSLRAAGLDAVAEVASASEPSPGGPLTLAIVISSSGGTPETVAAAARHRDAGSFVVGVMGRPSSPLARLADAVVPLVGARAETAGIASLSYRATVAALAMLGDAAMGRSPGMGLAAALPSLDAVLRGRDAWLGAAADVLDGGREVHVLGDGVRHGTIEQAALMLREAPRIAAHAFDTGDWLHVGLYPLFPDDAALLSGGAPADDEAVATALGRGAALVSVGPARGDTRVHVPLPETALADATVRRLVEPVVAELLAAELWRRCDAADIEAG